MTKHWSDVMATEAEIVAGAKAIALNCASVNCLRFLADGDCASKNDCCCRQDAKLAIEAAEKERAADKNNDGLWSFVNSIGR